MWGEVVSLGDSEAIVQIHDNHRQRVGGIPALCFLLATRVNPQTTPDAREEDASVILLRVTDHADLPNAEEARRVRVENAQRVSGETAVNWNDRGVMDATRGEALTRVVNFRDPLIFATGRIPMVQIGQVRYASTNRRFQQVASVAVSVTPTDLLGQKKRYSAHTLGEFMV